MFSTTKSNKNLRTLHLFFKNKGVDLEIKEKSDDMTLNFGTV